MMKIFLATVLLLILAFVVYAAYFANSEEKMGLDEIENVVKPKIDDIKNILGLLADKIQPSKNTAKKPAKTDAVDSDTDAVRYPLPSQQDISLFEDQQDKQVFAEPLPEMNKSDQSIKTVVDRLLSNEYFGNILRLEAVVPRFVATVDNLTKKRLGSKYRLVKPTRGKFLTSLSAASNEFDTKKYTIDDKNFSRYATFIRQIEAIKMQKLVAVYVYYYPLIQEAYDSLGYGGRYFNDRFVEVIDHLLATPEADGPLTLERAAITYKFANAELEARSAGQKIMLRVGKKNAAKLRKKLLELRAELTKFEPDI